MADTAITVGEATRIEKRFEHMEKRLEDVIKLMNNIYADVKVIKSTCVTRGETCNGHFSDIERKVVRIETDIDGGEKVIGFKTRVSKLEDRDLSKEKYLYLVIGALMSGMLALGIFLIQRLLSS